MKFTKLQSNEGIYKAMYYCVHDEVHKICLRRDDYHHYLINWFNNSQVNSERFRNALMELFYESGSSFVGNYLRASATNYYMNLEEEEAKNTFQEEYVEFLSLFE